MIILNKFLLKECLIIIINKFVFLIFIYKRSNIYFLNNIFIKSYHAKINRY